MDDRELDGNLATIHTERASLIEPDALTERDSTNHERSDEDRGPPRVSLSFGLVAAVIALVLAVILLPDLIGEQDGMVVAPGASASPAGPTPIEEVLPSGFSGEVVEPGVVRVLGDGIRDLTWQDIDREGQARQLEVVADHERDLILLASPTETIELGTPVAWSSDEYSTNPPMSWSDQAGTRLQARDGALRSRLVDRGERLMLAREYPAPLGDHAAIAQGLEGTVWRLTDRKTLERRNGEEWVEFGADEGVSLLVGAHPEFVPLVRVAPDGSPWVSMTGGACRQVPGGSTDCHGIAHFDGEATTHYLADMGLCVASFDIAADGSVWLQAWTWLQTPDEEWTESELRTYVIPMAGERSATAGGQEETEVDQVGFKDKSLATIAAASLAATAAPVSAQEDPVMTQFSGTLGCGMMLDTREGHAAFSFRDPELSDPRLGGEHISHLDGYQDGDPDAEGGIGVYAGLWEITNEEGSWLGDYSTFRFPPDSYSTLTVHLDGFGGYDGLTAVMEADWLESCGWDLRGAIVEGQLPDTPAPRN